MAIRTLGDPEEAADALQDAMIAAFRRAGSFRGDSAVTTWLHRIVVNAALDRMRRRAARPTTGGQDDDALDALASVAGGQPLSDPSGSTDTSMDVMAALRKLVPDQQAALVLVDMLGYSIADAAEVLGVSEGTVKSRAARGRARLLPRLAHLRPGAVPDQPGAEQTPDRRGAAADQRGPGKDQPGAGVDQPVGAEADQPGAGADQSEARPDRSGAEPDQPADEADRSAGTGNRSRGAIVQSAPEGGEEA